MKRSATKKTVSALLILGMILSSLPSAFAVGETAPKESGGELTAQNGMTEQAETSAADKDRDLIEHANALANGTQTYYAEPERLNVAIENKTMSLKYGLLADSDEIYLKNLSNTKGQAYIQNTFDVFVKTEEGEKFYASNSLSGPKLNIYRYGYYYYENRIEGQTFISDIVADPNYTYTVDIQTPQDKNSVATYGSGANGSAYFTAPSQPNDIWISYKVDDLNTEDYDFIEFKVKAENAGAAGQIFIVAGDATTYTAEQSLSYTFIGDNQWHVYRLPLTGISGYEGTLRYVRLDIDAASNTRVDIEYVRIYKSKYEGIDPDLSIQRSFLTYSDKLHHLTQFSTPTEITGISEVGMETKIAADTVNAIVVKDSGGLKYSLNSVDWATAEYAGFDIENAGIFGYILPADDKSGNLEIINNGTDYIITQTLAVTKFTPSEKGKRNNNDLFFGQRLYNDETHDFTAFIHEAECERHPLTNENIIVDFNEEGAKFSGYDALYGFYRFTVSGTAFNQAYYDYPNRHYNVRFTVKGDDRDRQMYFMTRCSGSGCLESAVLLNDQDMLLPIPMEVAKNFSGDGENTIYNIDDAQYGEAFFPVIVNAGEKRTCNAINLYQNWGRFPLKQISSIQFHQPYYHLSTGATETNCIVPYPQNGPGLPDHRGMSAPFWSGQPQHNSAGGHSFLRYTDSTGTSYSSQNTVAAIDSYGPTYCDITLEYVTIDGKVTAEYTHTEMPQLDENRGYYEMKYTFHDDVSFNDFKNDFTFYSVTDNNGTGVYQKVGYLDVNNESQVVDAEHSSTIQTYILGKECPYFSFFMMPDWNRESTSAQGYSNLSMLFKDWKVVSNGVEIDTPNLCLRNKSETLYLSMDLGNISFKAGDTITINAILMPWGSQEMEDDPANRLNKPQTEDYVTYHYSDTLPDGTLYMDKNVRDVRENTLLDPLTITADENCTKIDTPFVPKVKSTNGRSATFTVSGGYDNNTVRVYGFDKLTVPYVEEYVGGEWVEYEVSSKNTPDEKGYGHNYDGYMVHYDADGTYSYSFVFNMTDTESRTFRVSAEKDFEGWAYDPSDVKETEMNVLVTGKVLYESANRAKDIYYSEKEYYDEDGGFVRLYINPTAGESYAEAYDGGTRPGGKYIVYKYRIPTTNSRNIGSLQFWTGTERSNAGGSDYIDINANAVRHDGEWHVMVVDVTKSKKADSVFAQNEYGQYIPRYLRVDTTNAKMEEGDYVDVAYLGFSDSLAEIIAANQDMAEIDLINAGNATYTSISTNNYSPEGSTTLSIESASIHKSREITLKLNVADNQGLNFIRVIPKFDSDVFTLKSVVNGDMLSHMSQLNGSYIWQDEDISESNGAIATFTFEINEDAEFGKYEIELSLVDAFGKSVSDLTVTAINARVNIIEHEYGDGTGDGVINSRDIVALRNYLTSFDFESGVPDSDICDGADANGDGFINSADVTAIRKYLANYDYENDRPTEDIGRKE